MTNKKRTLDEPAVRELLTGLAHSAKRYYRPDPDTGFHTPVSVRAELMKLDMSNATASRLIRLAVTAGLITTEEKIDRVRPNKEALRKKRPQRMMTSRTRNRMNPVVGLLVSYRSGWAIFRGVK